MDAVDELVFVPPQGLAWALGPRTDEGIEVLVHIGIDMVSLEGDHFVPALAAGARVSRGDLLVKADREAVAGLGCDTTTIVIVTNAPAMRSVLPGPAGPIRLGDILVTVETAVEVEPRSTGTQPDLPIYCLELGVSAIA